MMLVLRLAEEALSLITVTSQFFSRLPADLKFVKSLKIKTYLGMLLQ